MTKEHEQRIYDRCIIRVGQLEEENARLRELVADIYEVMWCVIETCTEDVCADRLRELGIVVDRMHELGIEVE